jgi:hypothetical protein
MRKFLLILTTALSFSASAQERRLYIKPQINFGFPLTKMIRQDYLPYEKIKNNHRNAVIMPGVRFEYLKSNGNGYFFNFGTVPVGYSAKYTDYAFIDQFYRSVTNNLYGSFSFGNVNDAWVFDIGFMNRLASANISRKKAFDVKLGYGVTVASLRPYNPSEIVLEGTNSMNKKYIIYTDKISFYDIGKSKFGFMIPAKLDFNIKNKMKNIELLNLEFAYWHSLTRVQQNKITYQNITDNVIYENVTESKGSTWQMSVQVPIRIKRIGKKKF